MQSGDRGRRFLRREALAHHGFDLRPEMGVALALHVARSENAIGPGSLGTLDGVLAVIHKEVSENQSLRRIGGNDLRLTMDDTVSLIKIDGLGDVVGDD